MLRQRILSAFDVLSRLADSLPTPDTLSASESDALGDAWLLGGMWREFGPFWTQGLAWRLSQGMAESPYSEILENL